jgi:uncharacterized membrane protein YhaH (DUF805 family)
MNPLIRPWRHLFDFKGRATRTEYILFHVTGVVALMIGVATFSFLHSLIFGLDPNRRDGIAVAMVLIVYLAFIVTHVAIGVRRLHDQGEPGVKYLLTFIPLIGFFFWLMMVLTTGQDFENDYGPDPRQPETAGVDELGGVFS